MINLRPSKKQLTFSLYSFGMLMYALIFLLGVSNMSQTKRNTEAIQKTTRSTNQLVSGQNKILDSIKKVTKDTQLTAEQQTKIIICMLQVPVAERTTDTENDCRRQASASVSGTLSETPSNKTGSNSGSSSTQSAPNPTPAQSNNVQTPAPDNEGLIIDLPLIPKIKIPSPF